MLNQYSKELKILGTNFKELDSYSSRKGITHIVASSYTMLPPIISLCIKTY